MNQSFKICAKMKMFFIFFSVSILVMTSSLSEGRVRRQIWPAPGDPGFFWAGNNMRNDRDYFVNDFWSKPQRFNQPQRNQGGFRDDFDQNRRTTMENMGPITSTPRTIHYAPQGCNCPMTQQFNPVCGTDGNTYRNRGLLNCYQRCGTNVFQKRLGTC